MMYCRRVRRRVNPLRLEFARARRTRRMLVLLCLFLVAVEGYDSRALRILEQRTFEAINQQRREHDLPPLAWNDKLAQMAREHSYNMMAYLFFGHRDPYHGGLRERLSAAGVRQQYCSENIFQETGYKNPVATAVVGWMLSGGHRRSILDAEFTQTGIGVVAAHNGTVYFTQEFCAGR